MEPKYVKDIMDPSERKMFESMLVEEVATAVCLPIERVAIEEIRRLPPNDPKLVALKTRNEDFAEAMKIKEEEAEAEALADRERRKAKANPANYGVEHEYVESLRDYVEWAAEKMDRDPDEVVEKLGAKVR